jgi:4-hydroxy-3-methylbut-2-enyl diphosphate reductase
LIETVADVDKLNLDSEQLSYTTQTTLSIDDTQQIVDALKHKFPEIEALSGADAPAVTPIVLAPVSQLG